LAIYKSIKVGDFEMKKKILIVDDEYDIAFSFKQVLEFKGFDVDAFTDSSEALSNFKADHYDIGLLDIKIPKMDGFELYKKIKEIDNRIKLFFLTASEEYYEQYRKTDYTKLDRELFIQKPIRIEELIRKIGTT
jgi:two-component system response regulator ChvI